MGPVFRWVAVGVVVGAGGVRAGVKFNVVAGGGATVQVLNGVKAAAGYWGEVLGDDVTINVTVNVASLGAGETGTSNPVQGFYSYAAVRGALVGDVVSGADAVAVGHLPAGGSVGMWINRTLNSPKGVGSAEPYLDDDGDANNVTMRVTKANAKALGLVAGNAGGSDGAITFNSAMAFDYERSDGIGAGAIDFVGVAIHELGHVLGFFSGVDVLDRNSTPPDFAPDEQFQFVSVMDLFRYSAGSAADHVIDWSVDTRGKYFSIDGGATSVGALATGTKWGDGFGASHWKDDLGLGVMDPTVGYGELKPVSARDREVMDVIGYELVGKMPGDANGDGRVDADDVALIDRGYAKRLMGWGNGDFDGDTEVGQVDYLIIDRAIAGGGMVLVPETSWLCAALGVIAGLGRRRENRSDAVHPNSGHGVGGGGVC